MFPCERDHFTRKELFLKVLRDSVSLAIGSAQV
jgi:hypothetical protein